MRRANEAFNELLLVFQRVLVDEDRKTHRVHAVIGIVENRRLETLLLQQKGLVFRTAKQSLSFPFKRRHELRGTIDAEEVDLVFIEFVGLDESGHDRETCLARGRGNRLAFDVLDRFHIRVFAHDDGEGCRVHDAHHRLDWRAFADAVHDACAIGQPERVAFGADDLYGRGRTFALTDFEIDAFGLIVTLLDAQKEWRVEAVDEPVEAQRCLFLRGSQACRGEQRKACENIFLHVIPPLFIRPAGPYRS